MTDPTDMPDEESETVSIPITACPDCKAGDKLTLTVLSVDENAGTISATVEDAEPDEEGGSDSMAEDLGNAGQEGGQQ